MSTNESWPRGMTVNPQAAPFEKKQANGKKKFWRRRVQKENVFKFQNEDVNKFKTEMCKNTVAHGICVYGKKCQFAHSKSELRSRADFEYRVVLCRNYKKLGSCPYNDRCRFVHEKASELSKQTVERNKKHDNYKRDVCKFFDSTGTCPFGKQCSFSHDIARCSIYKQLVLDSSSDEDDSSLFNID